MPSQITQTPAWLTRPNPGHAIFESKYTSTSNDLRAPGLPSKPKRTIATRGSELFVAVGNEVRWTDLTTIKEDYEQQSLSLSQSRGRASRSPPRQHSYRTLRVPIHGPIQQLTVSPQGDWLAIATAHTVHVTLIPDSSILYSDDPAPIKTKTFQLGPTAHVLEEAPIATLLWHPLGYRGRCLITITTDAVVRLWELNRTDRSTFNEPALSVDLKKLANATNDSQDLGASKYGASKGFSPDSVELEVVSACFGDFPEQEGVHGWAPMTLWVAMSEGDVYALCPFLPSKWQLSKASSASTFTGTLATSINAKYTLTTNDKHASPVDRQNVEKQLSWLSDLQYQPPSQEQTTDDEIVDIYARPSSTPAIPLLQGPFSLGPYFDDEFELNDIIVFSLKSFSEEDDAIPAEGVPAAVVCLLTSACEVHISLDLEGIVGQWLPSGRNALTPEELPEHNLTVVETLQFSDNTDSLSGVITPDVHSDYSFFVTNTDGVYYISMESWIRKFECELSTPQSEGAEFRLKVLFEGAQTVAEQSLSIPHQVRKGLDDVVASIVLEDGNIGYFVLTLVAQEPVGVFLDAPDGDVEPRYLSIEAGDLPSPERRGTYQPPREFWEKSDLTTAIKQNMPQRRQATLKEEIKLSPANLELLMTVHRVLSSETQKLGTAVSDLFRRCERLRDEFKHQVNSAANLANRIDAVTGDDEVPSDHSSNGEGVTGAAKLEQRLEQIKTRQSDLNARYESIRRKLANAGGRELSEKEEGWVEEIGAMDRALNHVAAQQREADERATWQRFEELNQLKKDILGEARKAQEQNHKGSESGSVKVPSGSRKQENEVVEGLLERETALVEAAVQRLRGLGVSIPLSA